MIDSPTKAVANPDAAIRTRRAHWAVLGGVCALIVGIYVWSSKSGFLELWSEGASNTYYNLLVQGFRAGQLDLKREVPVGLTQLSDPYDPKANGPYRVLEGRPLHDLSYYRGKLYLYFGVTPGLVLFWPWYELTGRYLLHREAVLIFCVVGFMAGAGLLVAVWRRYFAEVGVWVVMAGLVALGLASGVPLLLARSDVYEVAIGCGYAMTMVTLTLIWKALHTGRGRVWWLAGASLAYGLAVGARPSLLFGAAVLLVPVAQAWRETAGPERRRRVGTVMLAASGPVVLIGLGLMIYNYLRFDNPFEFGWRQQLGSYRQDGRQCFGLGYLWFNVRVYFLAMAGWSGHFPFVRDISAGRLPAGYATVEHAFGVLTNVPVVWAALAAPLAWRGWRGGARSALRWFGAAWVVLFVVCALTLCLFWAAIARYEVEFLSPLIWLAVIGILGLERALAIRPAWRRILRWGWGLLLAYSVGFNLLVRYELYAQTYCDLGLESLERVRLDEAIAHFRKALSLQPAKAQAGNSLGAALVAQGKAAEAFEYLERAVRLKPEDVEARNNFGVVLSKLGRVDEAIVQYEQALRLKPEDTEAHYNLGSAMLRQRKFPEAVGHLEQVLRLKPEDVLARHNLMVGRFQLGEGLAAQGKWEEAITHYEQASALKPDQAQIHDSLGQALSRLGRYAEAVGRYWKALEIEPGLTTARNNLAWVLATCGDGAVRDGARAVELAEKANQVAEGKDPRVLDTLAAAYAEAGRFNEAVRTATTAIELAKEVREAEVAQRIGARLQLYQAGRPFREESTPTP